MSKSTPRTRSRSNVITLSAIAFLGVLVFAQQIFFAGRVRAAGAFATGNVVVYRVGDGTSSLTGVAAPIFLDEYTPAGTFVQTVAMPTSLSAPNKRLTASGSATTEGLFARSADGQYLVVSGYDASPGTTVTTATSALVNRVVGIVDANANIDTTTALSDAFSAGNIRSAVSSDGNRIWMSGSNEGVRTTTRGLTTSSLVSTTQTNLRAINIFNGQLYVSSGAGTNTTRGVNKVGTGLPTSSGNTTTRLAGFNDTGNPSTYGYVVLDNPNNAISGPDTIYVADDTTGGLEGGLQKWTSTDGINWTKQYRGLAGSAAFRGVAGQYNGSVLSLFAVTTDSRLVSVQDTGSAFTFTTLATAGASTALRGVALAPTGGTPTSFTMNVNRNGTGSGTVTSAPSGITCGATCSASFSTGTTVTLTATPDASSTFTSWAGCDSSVGNTCSVAMNSAHTVTATFTSAVRTLTVSRNGTGTGTVTSAPAGINCGGTCSATYSDGTPVVLTATADVNSTFTSWSGCNSVSGNTCNVTMTAARSVTATFTSSQRVLSVSRNGTGTGTVTSSPAGINCGATCTATYADGTLVTLSATPDSGSTFAGWTGACSGSGACTITMNADKSAAATFNFVPPPTTIKISQVYGGGGNSGSTYINDFVELYNSGSTPVVIDGWTVQATSATSTSWTLNGAPTVLSGTIQPGHYYLVKESQGANGTTPLPAVDATGVITMSGTAAKVALVASTATLSGACPLGGLVVDLVGYGGASCAEGNAPTATLSATNAAIRKRNGCQDTDNNANDFLIDGPIPRNSSSPVNRCGGDPSQPSGFGLATSDSIEPASNTLLTVSVTPAATPPSTGITVTADLTNIGGLASQTFYDDGTNGDSTAGDNVFSYRAIVGAAVTTGAKSVIATVTDAQSRTAAVPITLTVESPSCGVERWSVKVGTDPDAVFVDINNPVKTTIAALRNIVPPADPPGPPDNARIAPAETTAYTVYATLTLYKKETDVDYHMVLQDEVGRTMIAEIPSPACILAQNPSGPGRVLVTSPFTQGIMTSRAKFDARFTATGSFQTANIPVRVTGVGFFDFIHGQTGVAPNGIELHSILSLDFTANTSTTLMSSVNPSQFGQSVSFTATVSNGGAGTPTGNVTFFDGVNPVGTRTLDPSGLATFDTSTLSTGSHSITAVYEGDDTSSPSTSVALNQVVNKASSLTTVSCSASETYTGTAITPCSATVTGAGGLNQAVPVSYTDNINVGTATATAGYGGDANHESSSGSSNFAITKATSTTVVTCPANQTYTGVVIQPCTASYSGAGGLSGTLTPTYSSNIDAGSASASATYSGDANHQGSTGTGGFTINRASSNTTVNCPATETYTGLSIEPCTATVTGAGGLNQSVTPVTYTNNTNVGAATATATYGGDANHDGSTGNGGFAINKASSTTSVICPASEAYTSAPLTPCTVTVTSANLNLTPAASYANNINVGTATASYTYAGDSNHDGSNGSQTFEITRASSTTIVTCPASQTYTGAALTPCTVTVTSANLSLTPAASYANNINVGTATASYTYAGDSNHDGSSGSQTFEITRASSTTIVTCPASQTYTGAALTPCTVSVTSANLSLTPGASYANNINVGTATASYTYAGDANHDGSSDSKTFEITKANATINVTAYNVTYDGNPHTAGGAATGVNGESLSGLDLSGTTHTTAGTYVGDSWTFTDGTGNYKSVSGTVNDSISQATANITVNGYTGVYDGSAHGATGSALGVNGEDLASLLNLGASFTNVPGGTAHWNFAGNTNYVSASGTATVTISKATPVITWNNPAVITYGTALSATQLNATANVPGTFNYTPASGTVLNAGTAQPLLASFTPTDTTNYNPTSKTVMINVLKANPAFSNLSSPTIGCTSATTTLSGTISFGSFVPTGDVAITFNAVTQNAAIHPDGSFSASFATGSLTPANSPLGISYSYGGDGNFNPASGTGTVTIVDTVFPTITLNGNSISFWPPNHTYHTVSIADLVASASDGCDTSVNLSSVVIASVSSDEGNSSSGDILIAGDCKSVQLRAERDGSGDGRVYTITFRVRDAVGNPTFTTAQVTIAHDQGHPNAINSGVAYTVNSNCP